MTQRRESSDAPRIDTDDELTVREDSNLSEQQRQTEGVGSRIRAAISQMSVSEPDAERDYQETLRELAEEAPAAAQAVADIYEATPEDQYMYRWTQIQLLADLRNDAVLSVLDDVLSTPIPPEKAPDMVTYSTVGEEAMIRTTAIEGVTRIASEGSRQALELLRKHSGHENFSVRRAAIQGYLEAGGEEARDALRSELPERDQFILDIRRVGVQEVPQPGVERTSDEKSDQVPPARMTLPPRTEE